MATAPSLGMENPPDTSISVLSASAGDQPIAEKPNGLAVTQNTDQAIENKMAEKPVVEKSVLAGTVDVSEECASSGPPVALGQGITEDLAIPEKSTADTSVEKTPSEDGSATLMVKDEQLSSTCEESKDPLSVPKTEVTAGEGCSEIHYESFYQGPIIDLAEASELETQSGESQRPSADTRSG